MGQAVFAATLIVSLDGSGGYTTIAGALADAVDGDTILVCTGKSATPAYYDGAQITKAVNLVGIRNPVIGPGASAIPGTTLQTGFYIPASTSPGISISGFTFKKTDLGIYAINARELTVSGNSILSLVQGITLWNGSSCTVIKNGGVLD